MMKLSKRTIRFGFFEEIRRLAYEKVTPELRELAREEIEKALRQHKGQKAAQLAKSWHADDADLLEAIDAVFYEEYDQPGQADRWLLRGQNPESAKAKEDQKKALEALVHKMNADHEKVNALIDKIEQNKKDNPGAAFIQKKERELSDYLDLLELATRQTKKVDIDKVKEIDTLKKSIIHLEETLEDQAAKVEKQVPEFSSELTARPT